jgi:hypothetical protein
VSKEAEFDSESLCFHELPERRFERNDTEVKHRDLQGDFQQSQPSGRNSTVSIKFLSLNVTEVSFFYQRVYLYNYRI